ncbi:hypothetical protein BH11BAC5_BH11BAC5_13610 [soil metagenome]
MKRASIALFLIFHITIFAFGQNEMLRWSAITKLTPDDFFIKTKQLETSTSFGQFIIGFKVNGFDFLTKNFNKKVDNFFIKSASWIDTTANVAQSLIYQQTLFDLSEIYARQFRKALREKRSKILSGTNFTQELNQQYMTEFAKRRIDYDRETKYSTDATKQKAWEDQIQKELTELNGFSYNK